MSIFFVEPISHVPPSIGSSASVGIHGLTKLQAMPSRSKSCCDICRPIYSLVHALVLSVVRHPVEPRRRPVLNPAVLVIPSEASIAVNCPS